MASSSGLKVRGTSKFIVTNLKNLTATETVQNPQ